MLCGKKKLKSIPFNIVVILNTHFMLWLESPMPRLACLSVGLSACQSVGLCLSVFKTRFAMNQPGLQNKICFQC